MALHHIRKGLDLPIAGAPVQVIRETRMPSRVAVMADDFPGMKPAMAVAEGDVVKRGQLLFEDRKTPGVRHTAPGAGRVIGVHRGAKRALQSVVIDLSDGEQSGSPGADELQSFETYRAGADPLSLSPEEIRALLVESGQWAGLRTRPYSKVPEPDGKPAAIFVTAIDTNPLAPLPEVAIERRRADFDLGLMLLDKLCDGPTYVCVSDISEIPEYVHADVSIERFRGPHPAGLAGLHVHMLCPVNRNRQVWTVGYADVIAIGGLFRTGQLDVERVVSVAGPALAESGLVLTRLGAYIDDLIDTSGAAEEVRVVAGSVLSGKRAFGENFGFLGRHHHQVSVLREGRERVFLGWLTPGLNAFSNAPIYLSRLIKNKLFDFTTTTNGSKRVMVPIGQFESVMPMDLLPTHLLRALVVGDVEEAERLGALELDEEDLALCSFVCSGKNDYGPVLRQNLEIIEKEG
ncbi:MAG: Na(+)-translocating NADH-quinone reductase subunit A [Myxococcota bacterium]|nr:Na(+)-translocating NADH-quinone reductase subunit A [Myxococcota bacterium]